MQQVNALTQGAGRGVKQASVDFGYRDVNAGTIPGSKWYNEVGSN